MISSLTIAAVVVLAAVANGKVYFKEDFNDKSWETKWTVPTAWKPTSDMGEWKWTGGSWFGDIDDKGIQTSEDARFYGLSAKLDEAFTNKDKELVLQMSVKNEQDMDCGGAYIKLMGDMDQSTFGGDTPYQIMFGPDWCGPSNRKTHAILTEKGENLLIKNQLKLETDKLSHIYTFVVKPDNTFEFYIDMESIESGSLEEAWDFSTAPKEIQDPDASKPADWVDQQSIVDPTSTKPDDWDDVLAEIVDPEAVKPDDWDDEEDGEWEAPMISNPEYLGTWRAKRLDNPDYKGPWVHPMVPNPEYTEDPERHVRCKDCTHIGFELWQVKAGTVFDDILVTDSFEEAKEIALAGFAKKRDGEKLMYDAVEMEKTKEAEAAQAAASAAAAEAGEEEEEEEVEAEEEGNDEL